MPGDFQDHQSVVGLAAIISLLVKKKNFLTRYLDLMPSAAPKFGGHMSYRNGNNSF